ncbi:MAG: PfkB family carbohydrate kinase [bacterium]
MKSLCLGQSSYEINTIFDEFIVENNYYDKCDKIENGGGKAANAACLLGKWGVESYLSTAVGSDSNGDKIKNELELSTVKSEFVESNFDKDTTLEFSIINKKIGSKTSIVMTSEDKMARVKKTELAIEPDIIVIDGSEYPVSARTLNRFPNVTSIMIADQVSSEVCELSKYCSYIVCTKSFAEGITKIKANFGDSTTLLNLYNGVKGRYPRNGVIILLEDKGIVYATESEIKVMPSVKVDFKDTAGSAEVFSASLAYSLLNNLDMEKALTYSVIAMSMSHSVYGGRTSIPSLNNVVAYYNSKFGTGSAASVASAAPTQSPAAVSPTAQVPVTNNQNDVQSTQS